ncbi:MAG: very short patch repair endonuclease [Nitrospirae bacterium]|nr:very short patch repair endonuclease [Nitrospirota bacterium]
MSALTPQYGNYRPASPKASLTGKGNKRSGTRPEKLLINALRKLGLRVHSSKRFLPGNPDLVFWKHRLAVFCDGDFWHGKNWRELQKKLKGGFNSGYWVNKIEYNRMRDLMNRRILKTQGWKVIRVWESSILKNPEKASQKIMKAIEEKEDNCFSFRENGIRI